MSQHLSGALTKTYDEHIVIRNLHIIVNDIDVRKFEVFGLHGQLAFFYVKDLTITGFRCMDLGKAQYGIHICTFEDVVVDDVIIKGDKDGVHLGKGKRFRIRNGIFQTFDDTIALNAHDYDVGNLELGWIEDGIVESCHDLTADNTTGFFCRMLAGAWVDWFAGMEVQKSDIVVACGRLYRVKANPDGIQHKSYTMPTHIKGEEVIDGIHWVMVQDDITYTAGVRNVVFRDIFLNKPRVSFAINFENDQYCRSYYPDAPSPVQENIVFDNIRVLFREEKDFLRIVTPMDNITVSNSNFKNNHIRIVPNNAMQHYGITRINILGCVFKHKTDKFLINNVPGKECELQFTNCIENE